MVRDILKHIKPDCLLLVFIFIFLTCGFRKKWTENYISSPDCSEDINHNVSFIRTLIQTSFTAAISVA